MSSKIQHDKNNVFPSSSIIPGELKKIGVDIENIQLVTCQEDGLRELLEAEIGIVHFWFGKITKSFNSGKLVFRGQKQTELIKQLDKEYDTLTDENDRQYHRDHYLYHRLFFFGEKARCFYSESAPHDFLQPEESCCMMLFQGIKEKLSLKPIKLSSFVEKNPDLFHFFMDDSNINHFCNVLCKEVKLYWFYCILLHRLGRNSFLATPYISNSKDILISNIFSGHKKSKYPVIIVYVIPYNQPGGIYSALEINKNSESIYDCIKNNNLPSLSDWPYDDQQEITVPGCLFPHYMWFVIDKIANRIIVNPHIFTNDNGNNFGLHIEIDQKYFSERLHQETNYNCGISYDLFSGKHEIIS